MRVDDLTSIIRLAGIKRTVSEAGEQLESERRDAIAKLKKMTSGNEYNDANHTYIDPKTGAIIYSRDGSPMPASSFTNPKYSTASVGSELRNLLKQAGLSVTADAQGNARVDPAAFANLGKVPVAPDQSAAGPSGAVAPANNSAATTSAVPPVRITTAGPTASPSQQTAGITPSATGSGATPVANPDTNVSNRADYEGDVNPSTGGGKGAAPNYSQDAKKKVLAPVDPQLKTLQQGLLDTDPKYKELLGPFGADGRIGKYTRNALKQYVKDDPEEAKNPKLVPILTKYGIIPAASGPQGPGSSGASGPQAAPTASGPQGPGSSGASGPQAASTASGPQAAPTTTAASGPQAAPTTTAAGGSAKEVRQRIQTLADKYKVSESRLTPVGQIQKFRQLIDEAEAPPKPTIRKLPGETTEDAIKRLRGEELKRLNAELKTEWNPETAERYQQLDAEQSKAIAAEKSKVSAKSATNSTTPEPKLGNPEPVGKPEPKLGNPEPVGKPPPTAGTPVPGTPGYEFTGEVDAKGRPKARKIIVPPAAIEAEVVAAQQAGKLGLKQALPRVLGMTTRVVSFATGWQVAAAMMTMTAIGWMYDIAYENGTRVNISREDMVQLGKDKQALEALASNKNLSPEEQKEVQAAMEQMAKLLANSETIDNVWAKVGIPGRSGAPKK